MNFYLKQSKSKHSRDVLSYDFKRALSAAVIIRTKTSPIENENLSTELKNAEVADLEKERDKIQKMLKLQTLLEVANKTTTAMRERHMHFTSSSSDSDSNSPSPSKSSDKQGKGYNNLFSDWSSSSDENLAMNVDFLQNSRKSDVKFMRVHSTESTSNISRKRKLSPSTSPSPRGKHRCRKMGEHERFADDSSLDQSLEDEHRNSSKYSEGNMERKSSFSLGRRSDYSEKSLHDIRYGRWGDRWDIYQVCEVEEARQRGSNREIRVYETNAKEANNNRCEAFGSSKYSPNTTTINSYRREEYVSHPHADARRAYQHTNDKYCERGDIYRQFIDPKSNSNSKNGL